MKTLTFIGAGGFIGKSFLDSFSRGLLKKHKIDKLILISKNTNKIKKSQLNLKNVELIEEDITKLKKLPKTDNVIYGAEYASLKRENYKKAIYRSKKAIENFCRLAKKNKKMKILYISSGAVYKHNFNINIDKKKISNVNEAYCYIKKFSENKIKELANFNIKTSIARCFSFVGIWLPREANYAIGNFINDIILKRKITVKSSYRVIRSYMYADDMVEWLLTICEAASLKAKTFDVGSNQAIELRKLANIFAKLYDSNIKTKKITSRKINKYLPNIKPCVEMLGLKLNYRLKQSIVETINRINEKKNKHCNTNI